MVAIQIIGVCILVAVTVVQGNVTCRNCVNATNLLDCTTFTICKTGEKCYMQQVLAKDTGKTFYNGGCIAANACPTGGSFGRRELLDMNNRNKRQQTNFLSSCLRCCDDPLRSGPRACNDYLCGASYGNTTGRCYRCGSFSPETGVTDLNACIQVTQCQPNEMCRVTKYEEMGLDYFIAGCFRKTICRILASRSIIQYADYKNLPKPSSHKRVRICDICCDGDLCNNSDCVVLTEKMYTLWAAGALDINTLALKNGTTAG